MDNEVPVDYRIKNLQALSTEELKKQVVRDAIMVVQWTPISRESWDDPEEWQIEAAILAHGVIELNKREE